MTPHISAPDTAVLPAEEPTDDQVPSETKRRGSGSRLRAAVRHAGLVLACLVLALIVLWALFPGWFSDADPLVGNGADRFLAPSAEHPFGTDQFGRDIYARLVDGAWLSVSGVVVAVALALVVGTLLGLLAGFVGGWIDDIVMRVCDIMLAIPAILLSMAVITALGGGTVKVAIAVGIASVASVARTMRSEVLRIRNAGYVDAARASGVRWWGILGRHVLPNSLGPVIALTTVEFGTALLAIAALSFLGYGAQPPAPEWGAMIAEGRDYLATAWWLTTIPGLLVVVIVLSVNRVARQAGSSRRNR
ncbi:MULTISPECIES: ABC transporter permease [unclassified Streptomyces]|uniref:ABC transporter permease n=1 Tax=Streptomyces sp. NPDC059517 TaxID=3346855 RepID=UPI0036C94EB7